MKWQTLAPELIYEILDQCRADSKILSVTKPSSFPWYLGHICRTWREVFVSSPQFWNTMDIHLSDLGESKGPKSLEHMLEVARISMVRSRNCPISFSLSIRHYYIASPAEITVRRQMIKMLVANSARWFDAYLYILVDDMATIYPAKNHMPLLRSIKLALHTNNLKAYQLRDATAKLYSDFFVNATQLTRFYFVDISSFWKLNWSLITVICFRYVPPLPQLLAYLSQMPCLMELAFLDECKEDNIPSDGIVPITLPQLKLLHSPPAALFPLADTPNLQGLHCLGDLSMVEDVEAFQASLSRYFQSIRHLSKLEIIEYRWEEGGMVQLIIERIPRVDHLILYSKTPVELLRVLKDYLQMGFLKTVMIILDTAWLYLNKDGLLEIIRSWKRETGENRGIGLSHNLTELSFKIFDLKLGYPEMFIDELKLHLEEQGMHYSITVDLQDLSSPGPLFDVL